MLLVVLLLPPAPPPLRHHGPGNYRFLVWDGATRTVTLRGLDNKPQRRYVVAGFGPGAQWNWEQDSIYGPNGLFATTRSDGD